MMYFIYFLFGFVCGGLGMALFMKWVDEMDNPNEY